MDASLVMFAPDGSSRTFPLTKQMTVLGRQVDCDLRLSLPSVSRHHCRFVLDGDLVRLEDLGSSNGTIVNGRREEVIVLNAGDRIQVGPATMVLQIDGQPDVSAIEVPPAAIPEPRREAPKRPAMAAPTLDEIDSILAVEPEVRNPDDSGEIRIDA